ncbi:hypothetical protein [Sporosalibacterium faouarense]|uniref:hypothetical protein n=1 Tax=Sporosalibacterium faouarense TaxID=516123 RepID=UPI00141C5A61|nr:hypothetical protein [Sporosalibacterium faouarense]MTI46243.1 hypothetical protein [Bacillota bacterium]
MYRERVKTLFLLILIMVSILLANEIWIEIPNSFFPSFGSEVEEENTEYLLADIVKPEKILYNFDTGHTVFYSDKEFGFWDIGRDVLAKTLENSQLSVGLISVEEYDDYKSKTSLDYYFPENIHIHLLGKIIEENIPSAAYEKIEYVNNVHIDLGTSPFIVLSDEKTHLKISSEDIDVRVIRNALNNIDKEDQTKFVSMKTSLNINNNEYLPINMKYNMPVVKVKKEIEVKSKNLESIVEKFFSRNPNYIRGYEEDNGAKIYFYNQQILKIHSNGLLEYHNSIAEPIENRELYKSLNTAVNFVSNHVGWPEGSFLKEIEPIEWEENKGFRFKFTYKINGGQVVIDEEKSVGLEEPIEIEVYNNDVKTYKRYVKLVENVENNEVASQESLNTRKLSVLEILMKKENSDIIREKYIEYNELDPSEIDEEELNNRILEAINNIYIGYYYIGDNSVWIYGERLQPRWVIDIDGLKLSFEINEESNKIVEDNEKVDEVIFK